MFNSFLKMLILRGKQILIGDDDCIILEVFDVISRNVMDVAIDSIEI